MEEKERIVKYLKDRKIWDKLQDEDSGWFYIAPSVVIDLITKYADLDRLKLKEELDDGIKKIEDVKRKYPRMKTQDVIDIFRRFSNIIKK